MTEAQGLKAEIRALRETLGRVCDDQAFCRLSESVIEEVQTALGIVTGTEPTEEYALEAAITQEWSGGGT
jgi:hypothetical protein